MDVPMKKMPHDQQQKFLELDEPEQLFGGSKRGGKTIGLCQKAIILSFLFPGNRGLFTRLNFTDLRDSTINEFFQICPDELLEYHHKGERSIKIRTPDPKHSSEIIYRGMGDEKDFEKIKSVTLGWAGFDEPSEIPFQSYLMVRAQLTWMLPNGRRPPYMCLLCSNPEPGWVEDRFISETAIQHDGMFYPAPGRVFIPSLPRDNPFLEKGWEEEMRRSHPADWVKKYLDGVWTVSEGGRFQELSDELHNFDQFVSNDNYMEFCWGLDIMAAIDHGDTGTTAYVLVGMDARGNLFAIQEYYSLGQAEKGADGQSGRDKLVLQHAEEMHGINIRYSQYRNMTKRLRYILIDPSCNQRTQQAGNKLQSIAEIYREHGLMVVPAWNALEAGLDRIAEHLHPIPSHPHPFLGNSAASPSLFISKSRCPMLWKELRSLRRVVRPTGFVEYVGSDHALDCLRYIVNSPPPRRAGTLR
jgi:hypothetical protein